MITISKIDFQGDELIIQYRTPEDFKQNIKFRVIVVAWKANKEIVDLLNRLFSAVINKYIANDKEPVNWDEFLADLKKYEEKQ